MSCPTGELSPAPGGTGPRGSGAVTPVVRALPQSRLRPPALRSRADGLQQMAPFDAKNNPLGNKSAPGLQLE